MTTSSAVLCRATCDTPAHKSQVLEFAKHGNNLRFLYAWFDGPPPRSSVGGCRPVSTLRSPALLLWHFKHYAYSHPSQKLSCTCVQVVRRGARRISHVHKGASFGIVAISLTASVWNRPK